jgi:hypothetical protein
LPQISQPITVGHVRAREGVRRRGASGPTSPDEAERQRTARPPLLLLQRAIGNRAVNVLLRDPKPKPKRGNNEPWPEIDDWAPDDVTVGSDPLPSGASLSDADKASVVDDPKLGGGWTDGGKTIPSGRVGAIKRILLEGIAGSQASQEAISGIDLPTDKFAGATGPGKAGHRGRAVALVADGFTPGADDTTVIVHFHGVDVNQSMLGSAGMRARSGRPEDVQDFQIPQQMEAFLNTHANANVIVLMPIGTTIEVENKAINKTFRTTRFGLGKVDDFVASCFDQLGNILPARPTPGAVYLSGHSGGGFEIENIIGSPSRLPTRFGGVFGFEAIHKDHAEAWAKLAIDQLNHAVDELQKIRDDGTNRKQSEDEIAAAQLAYVRGGFRFAAFGGGGYYSVYIRDVRRTIRDWFKDAKIRARLKSVTGGRTDILDQLWTNYQAKFFAGSTHMNALAQDANFGRALASIPGLSPPAAATSGAVQGATKGATLSRDPQRHPDHDAGAVDQPVATTPTSSACATTASGGFALEHYEMSSTPYPIGRGSIKKPPKESTAAILRAAGEDPEQWYNSFTSGVTFLGVSVRDPIHVLLAQHLQTVERDLANRHGDGDPAKAGRVLGVTEEIIGSRTYPTSAKISMHMFGLALDINYTANPFVGSSSNDIFVRAGLLASGHEVRWQAGDPAEKRRTFERLRTISEALTNYFNLLDLTDAQLTATLAGASDTLWRDQDGRERRWRGMTAADARRQIQHDLNSQPVTAPDPHHPHHTIVTDPGGVGPRWNRDTPGRLRTIRATGVSDLKIDLILGMDMDWGAWYGDNMHFDLRNTPCGSNILAQIVRYPDTVTA